MKARARKLTIKNIVGLCVVATGAILSAKLGKVMINMVQKPRVCALCCSHMPFLMTNAGMVQDNSSAKPQ